jgi:hypothetical protein
VQCKQIGERLKQRITFLDRVFIAAKILEGAGEAASMLLGGGVLLKAFKEGGKILLVKTIAKTAVAGGISYIAGKAVDAGLRAAGADEETVQGVKHAAELVTWLLLLRKIHKSLPARSKASTPEVDARTKALTPPQPKERQPQGSLRQGWSSWQATKPSGTRLFYRIKKRDDIDWKRIRTGGEQRGIGLSNEEAGRRHGLPPELNDGSFVTLHHVGQDRRGPLVEASTRYHGVGKPGQETLHSQFGSRQPHPTQPVDHKEFRVDSREYWKWRAENTELETE